MKICLISFDYFNFDYNIIKELKNRGIEANHIDISKFNYKYNSFSEKFFNFFSKLLFNKNIKKIKTEEFILNRLEKYGKQDCILSIRPDRISKKTHIEIKNYCTKYLTYIYDSSNRFPIKNILNGVFDKIYSFDLDDSKKYDLEHISNYIYLDKKEVDPAKKHETDIFIISSIDERFGLLNKIANYCTDNSISFKFIIVGKKKPKTINLNIIYTKKNLFLEELLPELENSKVFLDLIRKNQNGLSFRIFEALAYQKKIITSNKSIKNYSFYNPNNILIIDENNPIIPLNFLETPYEPLPEDVYHNYTIQNWVSTVFELKD